MHLKHTLKPYGVHVVKLKELGEGTSEDWQNGNVNPGVTIANRMGRGAGYGFARRGDAGYGDIRRFGGVYQRRLAGFKRSAADDTTKHYYTYTKMRYYRPTNPRTELQQAGRNKFADAVAAWNLLTTVEKSVYNERGKKNNRIGRNIFISEYMASDT